MENKDKETHIIYKQRQVSYSPNPYHSFRFFFLLLLLKRLYIFIGKLWNSCTLLNHFKITLIYAFFKKSCSAKAFSGILTKIYIKGNGKSLRYNSSFTGYCEVKLLFNLAGFINLDLIQCNDQDMSKLVLRKCADMSFEGWNWASLMLCGISLLS